MINKLEVILKQIDQRIANGKPICAFKLAKHCKENEIKMPKVYMKLLKQGKLKYLK